MSKFSIVGNSLLPSFKAHVKLSNKSNELIVSDAAGGEAVRLDPVAQVAVPTVEVQDPAVSGIKLRTTPVVAA